ncbi:HTH-type transcriptional regulator CdhR [Microbulbifer sp. NBRC 101763]|uniref:GlxA family transcriptional regulator n=1 Tax=Microbulbifer TaxID=48073 RepID=UPI00036A96F5|nr:MULTISPECIES: GlxA family transcriptional regulator [Microbulbifer]WHI51237.1 GlxA family transcriptional regulator [Microbulbifer sp. MLAF003]
MKFPKDHSLKVSMVIYPGASSLDVTGPLEVFSLANHQLRAEGRYTSDFYDTQILADSAGPIVTASGVKLYADYGFREVEDIHTLLLSGGPPKSYDILGSNVEFIQWLIDQETQVERLGSICTGALILAKAGLLNGHRATTHWANVAALQEYADIEVDPDAIYIRDGNLYTSAGVTAGIDLALALVEEDHGRSLALSIARMMVLYLKRDGGQQQYSTHLMNQLQSDRFAGLVEWIYQNLKEPLTVERLAQESAMSPRNFARCFSRELGVTPARFIESIRVEKACQLLSEQNLSQERVACLCGFQSQEQLRRTFRRHKGILPSEFRRRFH